MTTAKSPPSRFILIAVVVLGVAAILFLLAGLFLPALAKAKGKAQRFKAYPGLTGSTQIDDDLFAAGRVAVGRNFNTEAYDLILDNPFLAAHDNPVSTFSIDVDTASYANVRRLLTMGRMPPKDAVRIEEMLNYFTYDYGAPTAEEPMAVHIDSMECPWRLEHRLVRIGIKAKEIKAQNRPPCRLTFLIDVSGSMEQPNKLPLLQRALELLVEQLSPEDRVAIVVYAGDSGLILDSTACRDKATILKAIRKLRAGGSTNGESGINLAYATAARHFVSTGVNRVILCTDGDFNVGVTSSGDLVRLIAEKAKGGVFLTVLGFGMGNYKDATLEKLADLGNGNYGYIDTLNEAQKLFIEQLNGTLVTVAKDVKLQIEFNPAQVSAYRLLGYENRVLRREDFNDDAKDAGELGAGHTVTALYEIVPANQPSPARSVDPLKYQSVALNESLSPETLTVKLRYKEPAGETSKLLSQSFTNSGTKLEAVSKDFAFASGVAAFGMLLRGSEHKGTATFPLVLQLAERGRNGSAHREEFVGLVRAAQSLLAGGEAQKRSANEELVMRPR